MKDTLDRDLKRGDLILEVTTGSIGAVEGTETATGQIRVISVWGGYKYWFKKKNALKIPLELFNELYLKMTEEHGRDSEYYLRLLMEGREIIMDIVHKSYL